MPRPFHPKRDLAAQNDFKLLPGLGDRDVNWR
jgi:hypothetical protein